MINYEGFLKVKAEAGSKCRYGKKSSTFT